MLFHLYPSAPRSNSAWYSLMEQPVRELRSTVLTSLVGPEILCRPVFDLGLRAKRYPKAPLFVIDLRCAPTSGLDLAVNRFAPVTRRRSERFLPVYDNDAASELPGGQYLITHLMRNEMRRGLQAGQNLKQRNRRNPTLPRNLHIDIIVIESRHIGYAESPCCVASWRLRTLSGCGSINSHLSAGMSDVMPVWAGGLPQIRASATWHRKVRRNDEAA